VRRLSVAAAVFAVAAALAAGSAARGPFTVPKPKTHECDLLTWCYGAAGPWVVVPAGGEATYLFRCPPRSATRGQFLLGGSDSLASSRSVRVWYDGQLGAPIGQQRLGSGLLFHAVTINGKAGSFQPHLGCISLAQAVKRSTVSARADSPPRSAPPVNPRATNLILVPGNDRVTSTSCTRREKLVGRWSAIAFGTDDPPVLPAPGAVKIATRAVGKSVRAVIHTATSVPYLIRIQVGAICQP
jgi:hypothetical protein